MLVGQQLLHQVSQLGDVDTLFANNLKAIPFDLNLSENLAISNNVIVLRSRNYRARPQMDLSLDPAKRASL
ncbi:hypothetical protein D3C86_2121130 [compost metagenome]